MAVPAVVAPTTKEIPYDYVAKFILEGRRGNRVQDVINISIEGAFVAVAIGYGFIPAGPLPETVPPSERDKILTRWATNTLIKETPSSLRKKFDATDIDQLLNLAQPIVDLRMVLRCLMAHFCGIDFKYSIIDSGTGRELQNLPIHNIAGLGKADGDRPFRPLAKPMLFLPRSTIRIEVEEISEGPLYGFTDANGRRIGAELSIVLHGYKILGYGTGLP
jgi:hypothetical protein